MKDADDAIIAEYLSKLERTERDYVARKEQIKAEAVAALLKRGWLVSEIAAEKIAGMARYSTLLVLCKRHGLKASPEALRSAYLDASHKGGAAYAKNTKARGQ